MAFIRCFIIAVLCCCVINAEGQTVYYPAKSSSMLKSTAADLAGLFKRAMPSGSFNVQEYTTMPSSGIILVYDPAITDNQSCNVACDGKSKIVFSAAEDNGLCFGIYEYLRQLGFRFYQPGTIWEKIPSLSSPYKTLTATLTVALKYKSWNISGGHNRWVMDNNTAYNWEPYFGDNGHNWALYQRRNGMTGSARFTGHRGDIMSGDYLSALSANPCYVANYEGSRAANTHSVPDINNPAAVQLWGQAIEQKYTQYRNAITGNTALYADQFHNFSYYNGNIGIEVPDGAQWGTALTNIGCNGKAYPKPSDQQFTLAAATAQSLRSKYPGKRFQAYAYSMHADVPSANISIDSSLDIQVISTAFQSETSPAGLMNRWYGRARNISEYHYLNIPQWGGETPMFFAGELTKTLQRVKDKQAQGIVWEASPAKFASLPFLLAANRNLIDNTPVDSTITVFCNDMFGAAAATINELFTTWTSDKVVSNAGFMADNRYKLPIYLQLVNRAAAQAAAGPAVVQERINELKAYLHYMVLYYDWLFDQRGNEAKKDKAAALCIYLAKINRLQIVNSYFLIADICSRYATGSAFYQQYNPASGTAYQGGDLPLITTAEILSGFQQDMAAVGKKVENYQFENAGFIKAQFDRNNLSPLDSIVVKLGYTNGMNYPNRSEFFIDAPAAGSFTIAYRPTFNMAGKGYINFTVEDVDAALKIIKDFSIDQSAGAGQFTVNLPAAGTYKLSVVSKYQSSLGLTIGTNGNYFYRKGPFLGNKTEDYSSNPASLPGYFYIPAGSGKIYFSINNSNAGGAGFAKAADINKAFVFKDDHGSTLPCLVTPDDSALFYIPVPAGSDGVFFRATRMAQYNLCFANTSNLLWYARPKKQAAIAPARPAADASGLNIYPNPSSGVYNCAAGKGAVTAEDIILTSSTGAAVGRFRNTGTFNISHLTAGTYWYRVQVNGKSYSGSIVKL